MDLIERLYRVLVGKHLKKGEVINPGINSWNIEVVRVEGNNYKIIFHNGKKGAVQVDMEDLEILSSIFYTKDINIGPENKAHTGCKTCDHGSDYQVVVHVNNAGFAPPVSRNFCFAWLKGTTMDADKYYYRIASQVLKDQCIETFTEHSKSLEMI